MLLHFTLLIIWIFNLLFAYSLFIPSQTNCTDANCYAQTSFNPILTKTTKSRCAEKDDCISTFVVQTYKQLIKSMDKSNKIDKNKMMILVCSKQSVVQQITLSINLNGEIRSSSFSFTFTLRDCIDCSLNLVEKIDSWIEDKSVCSAFKFPINQATGRYKEILYVNKIGYYLTVNTLSNNESHQAKTSSFIYPQSLDDRFWLCDKSNICLFFRGEEITDKCLKQDICTGRLMIYNLKDDDRFVSSSHFLAVRCCC